MSAKVVHQVEFSAVLFDTLFGLNLFYGFDSFFEIKEILPFVMYLFSMFILLHWWLLFKATDDLLAEEVSNSALDTIFGLIDIILIYYIILLASKFMYKEMVLFIVLLLLADLLWALIWRFAGKWQTKSFKDIKAKEHELNTTITIDSVIVALFLALFFSFSYLSILQFCLLMVAVYIAYIILTFRFEIADIKWF